MLDPVAGIGPGIACWAASYAVSTMSCARSPLAWTQICHPALWPSTTCLLRTSCVRLTPPTLFASRWFRILPSRAVHRGGRPPNAIEDDFQGADPDRVVARFGTHAVAQQRAERVAPAAVQVVRADDVVEARRTGSWPLPFSSW